MPASSAFQLDLYQKLEDALRPHIRERVILRRKRWLDGLISPFAAAQRKGSLERGRPRRIGAKAP